MTPPRQMTLALAHRPALGPEDFLQGPSNQAAYDAVTGSGAAKMRLALSGPEGSGKTHLASIWGQQTEAVTLQAADLTDDHVAAMGQAPAVVIEEADHIRRDQEALLFHALNLTQAEGTALLITGRTPPARWDIATPDLTSRLQAMLHIAIHPPDDVLLSSILTKLFSDRQLTVGQEVVNYIVRRMERSFAAAERTVDRLDRMALANRRPITRPLATEMFETDDTSEPGKA
ncbi:MAG: DnaA/Hda family protein [Pseudomonadota bacterium]